jgi:hypothetical protein
MRKLLVLILTISLAACTNNAEIGSAKDVNPESIYYDYRLWAEEGKDDATLMLQYRFGGENGTTLVLEEPCKVTVDGVPLQADSAKLAGAFYEMIRPLKEFTGKHTIVFTDANNKEHREEVNFQPFTLAAEFPEKLKKEPFTIKLNNFPSTPTNIRLVMTDTAFGSKDVNEEMLIEKGEIAVGMGKLNALEKGPVTLEIYLEDEKPLKNSSKEGGRMLVTYSVKRQFELVD